MNPKFMEVSIHFYSLNHVLGTVAPPHQPLNLNRAPDKQQHLGGCVITARLISDPAEHVIPPQPAHFHPVLHPKIGPPPREPGEG